MIINFIENNSVVGNGFKPFPTVIYFQLNLIFIPAPCVSSNQLHTANSFHATIRVILLQSTALWLDFAGDEGGGSGFGLGAGLAVFGRVAPGWREVSEGGAEDGDFAVDGGEDLLVKGLVLAENKDGVLAHFGGGEEFGGGFVSRKVQSELQDACTFLVLRSWFLV